MTEAFDQNGYYYFMLNIKVKNKLSEFNSNNTQLLSVEETKEKIASLAYIQEELAKDGRN